jgi:putative ABC transport system permease protein
METLIQDLRYGLRILVRSPGFTTVAVLTLAIGIGANSAIFSVVNTTLLRPLPYHEPERLVGLWEESPQLKEMSVSWPNYLDWKEQSRAFERLAATRAANATLTGEGAAERMDVREVTAEFLATLGCRPALGRDFSAEDDRPESEPVVIVSHGTWRRRFASDPGLVGRRLILDDTPTTVIGIGPPRFEFYGVEPDLWLPLGRRADRMQERGNHPGIYVVGRLKPGVSLEQARADLATIAARLEAQYPDSNSGHTVGSRPMHEDVVGAIRPVLLLLLGAVGLVLLIACVNVAGLMLARAAARDREISIRAALGSGRPRLVRMLLTESLLLGTLGGALGLLLAFWGVDLLAALVQPSLPRLEPLSVDLPVLGFTLALSAATGILFGLAPALQMTKVDLQRSLKEGGRGSTAGRHRLRQGLVVAEVALALMLLIGAGLAMQSFQRLVRVDPGLDPRGVLTVRLTLPESRYPDEARRAQFLERALERLRALPGVDAAGMVIPLPFSGEGWQSNYLIEGRPRPKKADEPTLDEFTVGPGYFRAMRVPLLRGRDFTPSDDARAPRVAIINQAMAERFWPGEDPIGRRIERGASDDPAKANYLTIVGVAGDVRQYGLNLPAKAQVYRPHAQRPLSVMHLLARSAAGDPLNLAPMLRREIATLDPDQPIYRVETMDRLLGRMVASSRLSMTLLLAFAATALLLASIGIYGVMAYTVTQRTHEIGIRMALGARRGDVLRLVVRQGMRLAVIGVLIGLAGAAALTRVMGSLLFGVSPTDPLTFAGVALLLSAVAALASYVPARRAARVDPMAALRCE